jgi:hypothetical protein
MFATGLTVLTAASPDELVDLPRDLGSMCQEAHMAGSLDRGETRARDRLGERALATGGDDHVSAARQDERGNVDSPEAAADIEVFEGPESARDDTLISFPAALDDEPGQGAGLGPAAMKNIEELIQEPIVRGKRIALENSLQNARPDSDAVLGLGPHDGESPDMVRGLGRELERDSSAK